MGRRVSYDDDHSFTHPVLYMSFFVIGIAANIAIISAICSIRIGFWRRKPAASTSSSSSSRDPSKIYKKDNHLDAPTSTTQGEQVVNPELTTTKTEDLPLPPGMLQTSIPSNQNLKKTTSERKASSFRLSMKLSRTLSVALSRNNGGGADNDDHKDKEDSGILKRKWKEEESVWMKTIILGEKCVPDEAEDAVIFDKKGKKISAYHPKTYSSASISGQFFGH